MIALPERFPLDGFTLVPPASSRARLVQTGAASSARETVVTERADLNGPRALVLHDSFGQSLGVYLSEHWSRAV